VFVLKSYVVKFGRPRINLGLVQLVEEVVFLFLLMIMLDGKREKVEILR
jgi:hypothetical protein